MSLEKVYSLLSVRMMEGYWCWHHLLWAWLWVHWKRLHICVFFFSLEHCIMVLEVNVSPTLGASWKVFVKRQRMHSIVFGTCSCSSAKKFFFLFLSSLCDHSSRCGVGKRRGQETLWYPCASWASFFPAFPHMWEGSCWETLAMIKCIQFSNLTRIISFIFPALKNLFIYLLIYF